MIKNYIKVFEDGSQVATKYAPSFGGNYNGFGDYYDIKTKKWYSGVALFADDMADTSNWTANNSTLSIVGGKLQVVKVADTASAYKTITTVVGKKYRYVLDMQSVIGTAQAQVRIGSSLDGYELGLHYDNSDTVIYIDDVFTASSTTTYIGLVCTGSTSDSTLFDNIAIIPLNDDGSIDISNGTAYTSQPTYLPYVVNLDESGNVLDYDKFDIPTLVEDYIKADIVEGEHKGKNSCTAWVNFDGTTTPPTIRDSYNVSQVIRTGTGRYDVYFEEPMDNADYSVAGIGTELSNGFISINDYTSIGGYAPTITKVAISTNTFSGNDNNSGRVLIQIFGGKN